MSATTHGVGVPEEFGESVVDVLRADVDARSSPVTQANDSAGDDWGTVLAVACLLVGLIIVVLLLGGG
ncbi:MAG TPA: hypothetical protein VIM10_09305 [Actinopolymorphaceae bacterium]|jgi:hypothetical protein